MKSLNKVKTTKKCVAYKRIKEMILKNELPLGELISETYLAEKLEMSRTPVRDALIFIQEVSITEAWEIYEIRHALEEFVLSRVVEMIQPENIAYLKGIVEKQVECMENNDPYKFMEYDTEMHMYLFQIYENNKMKEMTSKLRDRFFTVGLKALSKPGRMTSTIQEHVDFINALEKKDPEGAMECLSRHLDNGKKNII
jgi:DNA-binding GntR family transcriptional regulator